ncbi:MAG: quinone-dependent dihydroorotate dehydrogenase [Acidobacteria bacterium]|nr:quinone-dependent dihydroorotate dehydrogenase [Acidobacteriota bacterium]
MSRLWERILRPAAFALDAETAHEMAIKGLELGLASPFYCKDRSFGLEPIEAFGLKFDNPLGMAAGFDKNGRVVEELASLGFGFVEVGTVTLRPQPGNEKPRLFRLPKDKALINRLGFNNDGAVVIADRLGRVDRKSVIGVNIGRNKDVPNEEAIDNYVQCFEIVHPVADYIAVNVSSPNTPDLRALQKADQLNELLTALHTKNRELGNKPLLVKIAPDLTGAEIEAIVDACLSNGIAGVIATNTTTSRDGLRSEHAMGLGMGGLSGLPLAKRSTETIRVIRKYSKARLAIIGVGGIFDGRDAKEKLDAGATLMQAYTGFIYSGPAFPRKVLAELAELARSTV